MKAGAADGPGAVYHSNSGGFHFLGLRPGRSGGLEIVYDDGVTRRMVWRVRDSRGVPTNALQLGEALESAVNQARVVPALYAELKKRSISIDAVMH